MRVGSISAVSLALLSAACSSGSTAGNDELNLDPAGYQAAEEGANAATAAPAAGGRYDPATDMFIPDAAPQPAPAATAAPAASGRYDPATDTFIPDAGQQPAPAATAAPAAGGRYDPATDTFVPAARAAGPAATATSAAAAGTATASAAASTLAAPASPAQRIAFISPSGSPAGEVPLLVQACVQSVSGAFGNADGLAQRGYKLQRASETRRKFYRKFPVSTAAALNGSHRSSALELRANPRRSENYCSVTITTNESPGSVTSAVRGSLANAGFSEIGGGTWSNGSRQLQVSQSLSGSKAAWTTSVNITEAR